MLVVQGASSTFNPTLDLGEIAAAREADPQAAVSEWEGQFRSDLSGYLDEATLDAAIDRDRPLELAPRDGVMGTPGAHVCCEVSQGGARL